MGVRHLFWIACYDLVFGYLGDLSLAEGAQILLLLHLLGEAYLLVHVLGLLRLDQHLDRFVNSHGRLSLLEALLIEF